MKVEEALRHAYTAGLVCDKPRSPDGSFAAWQAAFLASLRANGFVVVPVKATENRMMRSACENCGLEVCDDAGKCAHDTRWQLYAETWRYMIAAAQENDDGR